MERESSAISAEGPSPGVESSVVKLASVISEVKAIIGTSLTDDGSWATESAGSAEAGEGA